MKGMKRTGYVPTPEDADVSLLNDYLKSVGEKPFPGINEDEPDNDSSDDGPSEDGPDSTDSTDNE